MKCKKIHLVGFSGKEISIDISSNKHFLTSPARFNRLVRYIKARPKHYHWDVKRDADLMQWIYASTKQLDDGLMLNTRIYWILHDIQAFKTCKNCGRNLDDKNVRSIYEGYVHEFCSDKCAASYQETKNKKALTTFERYGVCNCMQSPAIVKKMQDRFEQKNGVRSPMQQSEFKRRYNETMQSRYGVDWPLQNDAILSAAMQTTFEHYGTCHPLQNEQVKSSLVQYFLDTYGVENPMQLSSTRQKVIDATKQKFEILLSTDIASPAQIPAVAQKISSTISLKTAAERKRTASRYQSTCKCRYGTDNPLKSPVIRKQIEETCMQRYGTRNPMQCHEIQAKTRCKYVHDGMKFDSSDEIAYFIWLRDCCIEFEYQPNATFEYEYDGVKCIYCPDFYLVSQRQFVEIKGDHFFKDGKMICPWRKTSWTDEQYSAICDKYEAKYQCMLANGVKILKSSSDEVQQAIKHVKDKYGKDFFKKCRTQQQERIGHDLRT